MSIGKITAVAQRTVQRTASNITRPATNATAQAESAAVNTGERVKSKNILSAAIGAVVGFFGSKFASKKVHLSLPQVSDSVRTLIQDLRSAVDLSRPTPSLMPAKYSDIDVAKYVEKHSVELPHKTNGNSQISSSKLADAVHEVEECSPGIEICKIMNSLSRAHFIKMQLMSEFTRAGRKGFDLSEYSDRLTYGFSRDGDSVIMERWVPGQELPNIAIFENGGKRITYLPQPQSKLYPDNKVFDYNKVFIFDGDAVQVVGQLSTGGRVVKASHLEKDSEGVITNILKYMQDGDVTKRDELMYTYNPHTGDFSYDAGDRFGSTSSRFDVEGRLVKGRYLDTTSQDGSTALYDVRLSKEPGFTYDVERLTYNNSEQPVHYAKLKRNEEVMIVETETNLALN